MKKEKELKKTTDRREYKRLKDYKSPYELECPVCPMYYHCMKHKHIVCRPNRVRERNWKSQSKNTKQWK